MGGTPQVGNSGSKGGQSGAPPSQMYPGQQPYPQQGSGTGSKTGPLGSPPPGMYPGQAPWQQPIQQQQPFDQQAYAKQMGYTQNGDGQWRSTNGNMVGNVDASGNLVPPPQQQQQQSPYGQLGQQAPWQQQQNSWSDPNSSMYPGNQIQAQLGSSGPIGTGSKSGPIGAPPMQMYPGQQQVPLGGGIGSGTGGQGVMPSPFSPPTNPSQGGDTFQPTQIAQQGPWQNPFQQFQQQQSQWGPKFPGDTATYARGGRPGMDSGGIMSPPHPSFEERAAFRDITSPTASGPILSEIPGRLDHLPMSPAADSFVIPAETVAGLGMGNTLAGARLINEYFGTGPHGLPMPNLGRRNTIPAPPSTPRQYAKGGQVKPIGYHPPTDIMAAGGEAIIPPHIIVYHPKLGGLNPNDNDPKHYRAALDRGHGILRQWVVDEHKAHIKALQSYKGPHR